MEKTNNKIKAQRVFDAFVLIFYGLDNDVRQHWNEMLDYHNTEDILEGFKSVLEYYKG